MGLGDWLKKKGPVEMVLQNKEREKVPNKYGCYIEMVDFYQNFPTPQALVKATIPVIKDNYKKKVNTIEITGLRDFQPDDLTLATIVRSFEEQGYTVNMNSS